MAFKIEMIAKHIGNRLEDKCSDQDILAPNREEKFQLVEWDLFLSDLDNVENEAAQRAILEEPLERSVVVHKDKPNEDKSENDLHRSYNIKDTIIEKALRRCPPAPVLEELTKLSVTYRYSKKLYDLIDQVPMDDEEWTEIKRHLYRLCISKIYGLSEKEIKRVFCIRHGWREDTLLMLVARRNPPLKVVDIMLKICRESIAIVDTPLYDWIPVIYAIAYGASHEVISAMIPDNDDFATLQPLKEFNFLEDVDVYNRTPLHWTVFYGAKMETVIALRENSLSEALDKRDDLNKKPFEMAINEGTSMDIVEALLPDSLDFAQVEANVVRSIIYRKLRDTSHLPESIGGDDEFNDHNHGGWFDGEDEFADKKRYDVSYKVIPHLAKEIPKKHHLQQIMISKSCQTIPIVFLMLDLYACLVLIISFRCSTNYYLTPEVVPETLTPWLFVLMISISYMGLRELSQIYLEGASWLTDLWNLWDGTTITLVIWCTVKMLTKDIGHSAFPAVAIAATAMVWFNALVFLRSTFLRFSIFVSGLVTIIQDLIPFLIVSLVLLLGFGEMYNVDSLASGTCRNPTDGGGLSFCSFGDSLFSTYALFVGGIEMEDFAGTTTMKVISIMFGFFVAVILLNVVIAIVSNSWDSVVEEGKEVFWNYRLLFLGGVKNYEEAFICLGEGGDIRLVEGLTLFLERSLDRVCKVLWVRSDYW